VWDCKGQYDEGAGVEWGAFLHDPWRTQFYGYVVPTGVDVGDADWNASARVVLEQNTPNPFNPVTTISFVVPGTGAERPVGLAVYDVAGRLIRTLTDESLGPGRHEAAWDGRDETGRSVSSGIYFYRIDIGGASASKKMTLLK